MSWWTAAPELLVTVVWLLLPGGAIAWALRAQGLLAWLVAPAVSIGVIAGWAIVLGAVGAPWGTSSVATASLLTAALALAFRLVVGRLGTHRLDRPWWRAPRRVPTPSLVMISAGVVVGALVTAVPLWRGMGRPDLFPQSPDTLFHISMVRWVLDTADASSFSVQDLSFGADSGLFYPAAWHGLVSLAVQGSVVPASNVAALLLAGMVWPLGLAALAHAAAPSRPVAAALAPVAGAAFVAFPTQLLNWGVLWPNALSIALVPAAAAATVRVLDRRDDQTRSADRASWAVLTVLALTGVFLAQPNGAILYALVVTPMVVARGLGFALRVWRSQRPRRGLLITTAVLGTGAWVGGWTLAWVIASRSLRGAQDVDWFTSFGEGAWNALADGVFAHTEALPALGAAVALGALAALAVPGTRWLVVSLAAVVTVAALGATHSRFAWLTHAWYGDLFRLRAMVPVVGAVVIALGASLVVDLVLRGAAAWKVGRAVHRRPSSSAARSLQEAAPVTAGATALLVVAVAVATTGALRADDRREILWHRYVERSDVTSTLGWVTVPELELLERMDDIVAPDEAVIGNPGTGASFAFGVSGVDLVFPTTVVPRDDDRRFLAQHFAEIHTNPEVCALVNRLNIRFLYTDPVLSESGRPWPQLFPGVPVEDPGQGFERVDSAGTAALYEITAC